MVGGRGQHAGIPLLAPHGGLGKSKEQRDETNPPGVEVAAVPEREGPTCVPYRGEAGATN
eukprot:SAG11_NODE_9172_length_935_cov_2.242823_1_plen_60_part_00